MICPAYISEDDVLATVTSNLRMWVFWVFLFTLLEHRLQCKHIIRQYLLAIWQKPAGCLFPEIAELFVNIALIFAFKNAVSLKFKRLDFIRSILMYSSLISAERRTPNTKRPLKSGHLSEPTQLS